MKAFQLNSKAKVFLYAMIEWLYEKQAQASYLSKDSYHLTITRFDPYYILSMLSCSNMTIPCR